MQHTPRLARRMTGITFGLLLLLCAVMALGMSMGSAEISVGKALRSLFGIGNTDPVLASIIWEIRFPRVLRAALLGEVGILSLSVLPCFIFIFWLSNTMNLLLLGREMAHTMGVNTRVVTFALLVVTSFMVSATVCHCGLVGFVGLVMPHLLRLLLGPDHRVLVPACVLGGAAYMVACDLLARVLPEQGEMPAGVVTALIGAPLFIYLLRRTRK